MKHKKKRAIKKTKWCEVEIYYALTSGKIIWSFARIPISKKAVGKKIKGRLEYYEVGK